VVLVLGAFPVAGVGAGVCAVIWQAAETATLSAATRRA
jgi:hypothetical protein